MELQKIQRQTSWGDAVNGINSNNVAVSIEIEKLKNATNKNLGYFLSLSDLQSAFPKGNVGDVAYVGTSYPFKIYKWENDSWVDTKQTGGSNVSLNEYITSQPITDVTEILDTI